MALCFYAIYEDRDRKSSSGKRGSSSACLLFTVKGQRRQWQLYILSNEINKTQIYEYIYMQNSVS